MNLSCFTRFSAGLVLCLVSVFGAFPRGGLAATTVTVSELEKSGPNQGSLLVELSTTDSPTAFEMDFHFNPARVEVLAPVSLQVPGGSPEDFSLDSNLVASGTLRVVLSSSKLKALVDGTSMRVPVRAARGQAEISDYLPVLVSNMEISDNQAHAHKPKLGTTVRVQGFEKGVKYDGKGGISLALDLLKDPSTSVTKVEYFANSVKIQSSKETGAIAWKPPGSGTFELNARVTLADGSVVESRSLPVIVAGLATKPVKASYSGAVVDSSAARSAEATGMVTFETTSSGTYGSYSARLLLNGVSVGAAGKFGAESVGTASVVANLPVVGKKTLRLRFQQEATGLADTIRGVVTDGTLSPSGVASGGSFVSDFVANRNVWIKTSRETGEMKAKYTVSLPATDNQEALAPGFGVLSLSNLGVVTGLFTLADGTKSAQSGWVSTGGIWQPYASLYSNAGYLSGNVDFSDKGHSGWIGGWLDWRRSRTQLRELDLVGGKYIDPVKKTVLPVKKGAGNARLTVSGGSLANSLSQVVTLSSLNLVSVAGPNPYKLSLSIDRAGGGFTGKIWLPGGHAATPFSGVFLQGGSRGSGLFMPSGSVGTLKAGSVSFEALQ